MPCLYILAQSWNWKGRRESQLNLNRIAYTKSDLERNSAPANTGSLQDRISSQTRLSKSGPISMQDHFNLHIYSSVRNASEFPHNSFVLDNALV
jgi:hypothetical protein